MRKRTQRIQQRSEGRSVCNPAHCLTTVLLMLVAMVFLLPATGRAGGIEGEGKAPAAHLQRIMDQLNLTPEQQRALQPIVRGDREEHRAIVEKYRPQIKKIRKSMRNELEAVSKQTASKLAKVLTPEQMAQYAKLRDEQIKNRFRRWRRFSYVARILDQLNLSQEQRSAVQPIIQAVREKHRAFMDKNRGEGHEGKAGLRNELQAIRNEAESQLAKILTPEQMSKYTKLRDEFIKSRRGARAGCRDGRSGRGSMQQGS